MDISALHIAAVMCDTLHAPDNGHIVYSPDVTSPYNFGTVATCVCDSGYGLSGGTRTLRCGGNDSSPVGLWGGSTPSCLGTGGNRSSSYTVCMSMCTPATMDQVRSNLGYDLFLYNFVVSSLLHA